MQGKTCLVTGANSGIGKETARGLAKMGARVILVCRDRVKGEFALSDLKKDSRNKNISLLVGDLSSVVDIRRLAIEIKEKCRELHVLVNNVGVYKSERHLTDEGLESVFATNHMSYFLLTNLLIDLLKDTGLKSGEPARIVNVSSEAHRMGSLNLEDLQSESGFKGFKVYANSKLHNLLFTYELARKLADAPVTVNALHPGAVASNFAEASSGLFATFFNLGKVFMKSPANGARTSVFLASAAEVAGTSGCYFDNCKKKLSSPASQDLQKAAALWEKSQALAASIS